MNDGMTENWQLEVPVDPKSPEVLDVTELLASSPVLARLVEEVRNEQVDQPHAYNRMHNRHNRSR